MSSLDRRPLAAWLLIAFGFSWALHLAVFFGPGMGSLAGTILVALSMFGPTVATFAVTRWVRRPERIARDTGLVLGRNWGRYWVLAFLGTPALILLSLGLSVALGTFDPDLTFSSLRAGLEAKLPADAIAQLPPLPLLVALQVGSGILLGPVINAPVIFGEEWGWRGWLQPALQPLGMGRGLIVGGVIWGLWHAPIILQGHNYPSQPVLGVGAMIVFCLLVGALLGWTRHATGSIWPAVIAHGSINALGPVTAVFLREGDQPNMLGVGILGWPGWLLMGVLVAVIALTQRKRSPSAPPAPTPRSIG